MKKLITLIVVLALSVVLPAGARAAVTLEECLEKAAENYPLIRKYDIVAQTRTVALSDINKDWLPRVGVYGQATAQNRVPEFPQALSDVLSKLGQNPRGLGRVQYKVGADVEQTVWDGGSSRARRQTERALADERRAQTDVQMYAIRERVIDLYFGILLLDEQTAQTENTLRLLEANFGLMRSMVAGGVAMQSDADMIEAQALTLSQQLDGVRSEAAAYRKMLGIYTGSDLEGEELARPEAAVPSEFEPARPELRLFDAQTRHNLARLAAADRSMMPRVGFFAQVWYGYPGINYFESMLNRNLSFNALAGIKVSWNIDSFYTRANRHRSTALVNEGIAADRDVFLFNTRLQTDAQTERIEGLRKIMAEDARIVELRGRVRAAAESQLRNGVIDATALLDKITDENQALLTARYHEIEMIQNIYRLKNILNR